MFPLAAPSRQRAVYVALLVGAIAASWLYLLLGAGMRMEDMGGMLMSEMRPEWNAGYASLILAMWLVMMAAMMLPGAMPMLLLHHKVAQQTSPGEAARWSVAFGVAYLAVWFGFSVLATFLQWSLDRAGVLSGDMAASSKALAAALLIIAGSYQWTPWKSQCVSHCRSPLDYVLKYWRRGIAASFSLGLRHGVYCVGCCWALMLLLFVGGVMNLAWVALIAAFILVEKTFPRGDLAGRLAGLGLVAWGVGLLNSMVG